MKKTIARIIFLLLLLGFLGLAVYQMYVKPMMEITNTDGFFEYLYVFLILTAMYGILVLLVKGLIKLIDWCISNAT